MQTLRESAVVGDVVLYEAGAFYSRGLGTIAAGADLGIGAVLGRITASDKLVAWDPGVGDGSEVAVAVLLSPAAAAEADVADALLLERHATVKRHGLVWGPGVADAAARAAGIRQLRAIGIVTDV